MKLPLRKPAVVSSVPASRPLVAVTLITKEGLAILPPQPPEREIVSPNAVSTILKLAAEALTNYSSAFVQVSSRGFEVYRGVLCECIHFRVKPTPSLLPSTVGRYKGWLFGHDLRSQTLGVSAEDDARIALQVFISKHTVKLARSHR